MNKVLIFVLFLIGSSDLLADENIYVTFGLGVHSLDFDHSADSDIGMSNPLGLVTIGYKLSTKHKINMEFQHISSIPDSADSGLNSLFLTVTF